jgi:S-adenosylmethionine:tRNA ribosyltransferase-isomerase
VNVSEFDFDLPDELIAQQPSPERGGSRLMVLDRSSGQVEHRQFNELVELLHSGDLLVVNDTRVFPARLLGTRLPGGGAAECFLVRETDAPDVWVALVHPGQRLREGSRMAFAGATSATNASSGVLHGEILGRHFHGRRTVRLWTSDGSPVRDMIDAIGHVPLPPYIKRDDAIGDHERYQTVYARRRGSIAAPTAGLHFTPAILDALRSKGVDRVSITLHVGYGTFQPIRVDRLEDHQMEAERYDVSFETAAALTRALKEKRRVIAVGTTTTRTLESLAIADDGTVTAGTGETSLFIHPGRRFQIVSGLVTNFHLPRSSLLMLVSAFATREHVLTAYREAVANGYRFYSYGDAMFIA